MVWDFSERKNKRPFEKIGGFEQKACASLHWVKKGKELVFPDMKGLQHALAKSCSRLPISDRKFQEIFVYSPIFFSIHDHP